MNWRVFIFAVIFFAFGLQVVFYLFALLFFLLFNGYSDLVEVLLKLPELRISTVLDQEGKWQHVEWINSLADVVLFHIQEDSLFIGELFIVVHPPVYFNVSFQFIFVLGP